MKFLLGTFVVWSLSTGRWQAYLALATENNNPKPTNTTKEEKGFFGFGGGLDQMVNDYIGNSIRSVLGGR